MGRIHGKIRAVNLQPLQFTMRVSQFFISTQKEAPTEAELPSHKLMVRAGYIKKLASGLYTWMPLGLRALRKVEAIVREVGFRGSFAEFLTFLRTDPQFYATTPEQILREAAWITREVDAQMPRFFGNIPRTPYTVRPVPEVPWTMPRSHRLAWDLIGST